MQQLLIADPTGTISSIPKKCCSSISLCPKEEMLTLPNLDVCKLAKQICGCLCAALGWIQTERHCVLNTHIFMHRLPWRTIPAVSVLLGNWCYCLLVFNPANSICQTVGFRQFHSVKSLVSRGHVLFVQSLFSWPGLMTDVLFISIKISSFGFRETGFLRTRSI